MGQDTRIWYVPHEVDKMTTSGLEAERDQLVFSPLAMKDIEGRVAEINVELHERWKRGEIGERRGCTCGGGPTRTTCPTHGAERFRQNRKTVASPPKDDPVAEVPLSKLRDAFIAGFMTSGEGFNGEWPFQDQNKDPFSDEDLAEKFDKYMKGK